jgi:RNA polymerase sigma-70 factor, ECF subfamily
MTTDTVEVDARVRALLGRGERDRATEVALREYGAELIAWLRAGFAIEADAHDAFSRMSEDLWKSLGRFDGRCSVRTWCYMLARHAAARVRSSPRRAHELLVSSIPSLDHAMTELWSTSLAESAERREVFSDIRATLDEDDRALLELRIQRNLAWSEIALILLGDSADDDAVAKKAAALRKQFERVKERLRALAAERTG